MSELTELKKQQAELDKQRAALVAKELEYVRATSLACTKCHKWNPLLRWTFIQNHWYERPHGCTGGAEWHRTKAAMCHVVCPECRAELYLYNHPQRDAILELLKGFTTKQVFAKVEEQHDPQTW